MIQEGFRRCDGCGEPIEEPKRLCHSCTSDIKSWIENRPNIPADVLIDYLWEAI